MENEFPLGGDMVEGPHNPVISKKQLYLLKKMFDLIPDLDFMPLPPPFPHPRIRPRRAEED